MIPKIIHYCWFGESEKSALHIKCIESWKKYLPEILKENGFLANGETQIIDNICLYEKNVFCPYGIGDDIKEINKDSYTIHWCEGSWFDKKKQNKLRLIKLIKRIVGTKNYYKILKKIKVGR